MTLYQDIHRAKHSPLNIKDVTDRSDSEEREWPRVRSIALWAKIKSVPYLITYLANGLSSCLARGHNGNDLDVLNFLALQISRSRRAVLNSVTNRECTFRVVTSRVYGAGTAEIQFKNAIMMLAAQAAVLVPDDPQWAVEIFSEILRAISRVKYCRPKPSRPAQPSPESPSPPNKWCSGKRKKLEEA